ncbi:hypothetical protein AU192_21915 [Mycobacterium lehmannii]|uniref:DUF5642 domain-containing protein n=1 Tax=Mycobacterium lehmannii TaxID=2048550 RepID=A0A101A149_9MYCO|nr:hypothetical protein [Mycobacterium lehmannii]KUI10689.1 hypothetical protein AU192_21915 [Mycobacterium lehmannii]KUI11096.1 hypothetical protein AU191_08105 [Mycolicibacterium acapulense]
MSAAATTALICAAAVGCDAAAPGPDTGTTGSTTSPTGSPAPAATTTSGTDKPDTTVDYGRLLLQASDLSDDEDTFTVQSTNPAPGGLPGASALFVNQDDTRAIANTVVIYPDAETATRTLREAIPQLNQVVADATPRPAPVGADGIIAVGESVDRSKAETMLLFTRGPALVRLEFQSALGDATTDEFVINVGRMQDIALRTGLPEPR